jgi:SigmaK-factor processing regulatory protein BofA
MDHYLTLEGPSLWTGSSSVRVSLWQDKNAAIPVAQAPVRAGGDEGVLDASSWVLRCSMELIILILVIALVAFLALTRGETFSLTGLIVNGILGVVLIFLTNLILSPPIPINIFTVLICAIGGVLGWLILLVLHILAIAF